MRECGELGGLPPLLCLYRNSGICAKSWKEESDLKQTLRAFENENMILLEYDLANLPMPLSLKGEPQYRYPQLCL